MRREVVYRKMNEKLTDVGRRIDKCFIYIKTNISLDELADFGQYIKEQETLMPLLQTTAYNNGGYEALELVKQRIESLKNLLEAEEKLLKEAKT